MPGTSGSAKVSAQSPPCSRQGPPGSRLGQPRTERIDVAQGDQRGRAGQCGLDRRQRIRIGIDRLLGGRPLAPDRRMPAAAHI
jgi:hypothetical protein